MVTFCLLVAPLPYGLKKRLFTFLTESKIVAKVAYGLKISFMCVLQLANLLRFLLTISMFSHSQFRGDSLRRRAPTNVPRRRRVRPRKAQQGARYSNGHGTRSQEILVRSKLREAHTTAALYKRR